MLVVLILALSLAVAVVVPGLVGLYWLRILTTILMFAAVAQGINIMVGFVGYPAFGNVVFFGIGAYATGIVMAHGKLPLAAGLATSVLACLLVTVAVGPALLRLKGHYFAIASLGLNEATKAIVANLTWLTGGGTGLSLPLLQGSIAETSRFFFHAFVALAAISCLACLLLQRSRFGLACRAVRANEMAARSAGVPVARIKLAAWALSAAITGIAGGLYAAWYNYIDPNSTFNLTIAVKAFVMMLIGGMGTVAGPLIGAAFIESVTTLAWSNLLHFHLGLLGLIIIATVLGMPNGFLNLAQDLLDRHARANAKRPP